MGQSVFIRIRNFFFGASPVQKVLVGVIVLALLTAAVASLPHVRSLVQWAQHAVHPLAQTVVMVFLALATVYGMFAHLDRGWRTEQAQREKAEAIERLQRDFDARSAELHQQKIAEAAQRQQEHAESIGKLREEHSTQVQALQTQLEQAQSSVSALQQKLVAQQVKLEADARQHQQELEAAQQRANDLQRQWERITELEANQVVWRRGDTTNSNAFLPLPARKTVFVSMMNLKGGVGKTTLSANLAACWAQMDRPLRVLVVDLDSQGSLGNMCVEPMLMELQKKNGNTTAKMLAEDADFDLLDQLAVPMTGIDNARVIFARDDLEQVDHAVQNRFLLRANQEVRFRFQKIFHQPQIREKFDVVVFDCPPRLTSSSINALCCSDYLVIPTRLDDPSVSCVPRTLDWIQALQGVMRAKLLAVVANGTSFACGKLVNHQAKSFADLGNILAQRYRNVQSLVCRTHIKQSVGAVSSRKGTVAAATAAGRHLFKPLAMELRGKLRI